MDGVFVAELAIFLDLDTVGIVLLVLVVVVVALFALGARKRNLISLRVSHNCLLKSSLKNTPSSRGAVIVYHIEEGLSSVFRVVFDRF